MLNKETMLDKSMKNTYITPSLLVKCVATHSRILAGSLQKFDKTVSGGDGGWTKDEHSDWSDIWE